MANVIQELTEQLSKKVGSDDIAKGIVEGFQAQKGAERSSVQKQIKSLIRDIDADEAIKSAKFADQFTEGADGQVVLKHAAPSPSPSVVDDAVSAVDDGNIPGQISMFQDSTGEVHTADSKIRQIKEAKRTRTNESLSEADDGQMFMNFGNPQAEAPKPRETVPTPDVAPDTSPIPGQDTFIQDQNGNLNYRENVARSDRAERAAEVENANKTWIQKRLEGGKNAINAIGEVITGTGEDASKRLRGRKTREAKRANANAEYEASGIGSAQSRKDFYESQKGATTQEAPRPQWKDVLDGSDYSSVAQQNAESGAGFFDGIPTWAKGIGIGTAAFVAGGVLMDDKE